MEEKILAIDPGFTTGYAQGRLTGPRTFDLIETGAFEWEDRFDIFDMLAEFRPDIVVMEDFVLYEHKKDQQVGSRFPSAKVIGMIDGFLFVLKRQIKLVSVTAMQPASTMQSVTILDHDKSIVGSSPHRQDAYKHLRYYVLLNGAKIYATAPTVPTSSN